MTARQRFRADVARYSVLIDRPMSRFRRVLVVLTSEEIWAMAVFRFGQYVYYDANPVTRWVLRMPCLAAARLTGLMVGIHLFADTRIGPGFCIVHYGGIWISPLASLGANCSIGPGVVIGVAGQTRNKGPVLGDRVWVGPGAIITGDVKIGSGAVIAANSLVTSDVPENAVVIGVPARVISYSGSEHLIRIPTAD
jgi:serine O-acetyltransferase